MADPDWNLGKSMATVTIAIPHELDGTSSDPIEELFQVTNYRLGTRIRATRPRDHLVLTIIVRGYTCEFLDSGRRQPQLFPIPNVQRRKLRVEFPPQHIAEQIKDKPLGDNPCRMAAGWGAMRVRLSQPSRLVFAIPDTVRWRPRLRLAALTDWSALIPLVHRRAGVGPELRAQMRVAFPGYEPGDWASLALQPALDLIGKGLSGPDDGETSLEIPARLILSPSAAGRWLVRGPAPGGRYSPLWTARLDRTGRGSVRAIWSNRIEPLAIPTSLDDPPSAQRDMLSLGRRHHWEIVAQTSVYGLPALRRLPNAASEPGPLTPRPAVEADAVEAPRPTVVRPDVPVGFLMTIDSGHEFPNQDSGIALASPFDDADISLSALGAIAHMEWRGDPPQLLLAEQKGRDTGLALERLKYIGYLGRDAEVVATDKGYLFPLGIRASLVTVHERAIYANALGEPVSYLIRRTLIVTPGRTRSYPGPYQPFDGREFPARRVTIKTLATPDLAPQLDLPLVLAADAPPIPAGALFWPQTLQDGVVADVPFEWATEDAVSARSTLIFVRNDVITRPDVMQVLVAYYNREPAERRTASLGGARHRYAEPAREGDTSFDTTSWVLAAQGRRDGPGGAEHFAHDGRMEGADQPPFYPLMERGYIGIQSIEQMLGAPLGPVEVRYFGAYREKGFDTPHQIFLELGAAALAMQPSARAERSGGIASPNVDVAALSRLTGPVGGYTGPAGQRVAGTPADFSSAVAGVFEARQFLADAKLLGFQVADLIEGGQALGLAPQLIDESQFGAGAAYRVVQEVARTLESALYGSADGEGLVAGLQKGLDQVNAVLGKVGLTLDNVYPSLMQALTPFLGKQSEVQGRLTAIVTAAGAEGMRPQIGALVPRMRALLDAVADVIKDPVPDAFEQSIRLIQQVFETLRSGADAQLRQLQANALALLHGWLKQAFCAAVDGEGFGVILFGQRGERGCDALFDDPGAAVRAFGEGLYGPVLDQVLGKLAEIVGQANDLAVRLDEALDWLDDAIALALEAGVTLVAGRLAPLDPTLDDIRQAKHQLAFVNAVLSDLRGMLAPDSAPGTPQQALDLARERIARLPGAAGAALDARLAALQSLIHVEADVDAHAVLEELAALVRARILQRVIAPLEALGRALIERLARRVADTVRGGLSSLLSLVTAVFDALLESSALAAIAEAGRNAQEVCDAVGNTALVVCDQAMAPLAQLESTAQAIADAAQAIDIPASPQAALNAALATLVASVAHARDFCRRLEQERVRLRAAAATLCAHPAELLEPVAAVLRLRAGATGVLAEIARQCQAIGELFVATRPISSDQAALREANRKCADLAAAISGVAAIGRVPPQLLLALRHIDAAVGDADYRTRLHAAADRFTQGAAALASALDAVATPERLVDLLEGELRHYQQEAERELTALLLQSVGWTPAMLTALEQAATGLLKGALKPLPLLYEVVDGVLTAIVDMVPSDETLAKVFRLALGGDATFARLVDVRGALNEELRNKVEPVVKDPTPEAIKALLKTYREGKGALPQVMQAVEGLRLTDVGQSLTEALRTELKRIEEEVRTLLMQLVPTKLQTRYFWTTELKPFPDADPIFAPAPYDGTAVESPTEPPPGHPAGESGFKWHLWIDGNFSFDVITGAREVKIVGVLRPCQLNLLGQRLDMLTIYFDQTRFTSVNGAAPRFEVKVTGVKIGKYLQFIEQLQQWLSPKGSGLYAKPTEGFAGIEVGYVYDAGIIQIGTLQFINVAFRVAAILPFSTDSPSKGKPRYEFALAGPERPFLISSPPYGGGGWVTITCSGDRVEAMDLAFVFGGVAAIKFGPLDAQGRIVAGVRVRSATRPDGKQAYLICAIFEAVGEGSIACFSIAVSIRVALEQTVGGALFGSTTYRFSFKLGFARLGYSVAARYRLSSGSDPGAARAPLLEWGAGGARAAVICTEAPAKESAWQAYRSYFDLDLLEDA